MVGQSVVAERPGGRWIAVDYGVCPAHHRRWGDSRTIATPRPLPPRPVEAPMHCRPTSPIARVVIPGLLLIAASLVGCGVNVTYPPVEGTPTFVGTPVTEPVPTLMTEAVRYVRARHGRDWNNDFAVNLPLRTKKWVYDRVIDNAGGGRIMTSVDDYPVIQISSVRVRGLSAEVDVTYPRFDTWEFATLTMERDIADRFRVTRDKIWRLRVKAPVPHFDAVYDAPPPLPPAAAPADADAGASDA